jgi:hypothetical protein
MPFADGINREWEQNSLKNMYSRFVRILHIISSNTLSGKSDVQKNRDSLKIQLVQNRDESE